MSPAAQAVLDGFRAVPTLMDGPSIAAALRVAADQLYHGPSQDYLLELATELENTHG
jgi:hypothetical protein